MPFSSRDTVATIVATNDTFVYGTFHDRGVALRIYVIAEAFVAHDGHWQVTYYHPEQRARALMLQGDGAEGTAMIAHWRAMASLHCQPLIEE